MPGNHDRFRSDDGDAGCKTFDLSFTGLWGQFDPDINSAVLRSGQSALGIVAADFCLRRNVDASHPTNVYKRGQGYAYEDIVEKLVKKTLQLRSANEGIGIVWAMHFPPSDKRSGVPALLGLGGLLELRFFHRVVTAAVENDVSHILSGHLREAVMLQERGVHIYCAGSACGFGEASGNWMHLLEFRVQKGKVSVEKKVDYRWIEAKGDFFESQAESA